MLKLTRGGLLLPLFMLLMVGTFAPALSAQDSDFKPNPTDPITVDFVQKDLHTVMHYIALRSGLQIIVEGQVDVKLTVMFRDVDPKSAIQSICKANKLDYIEDGQVIIIKRRPQEEALANVVNGEIEGRFNVNFESHELVTAILEVANVTHAQVFVPATLSQKETKTPQTPDDQDKGTEVVTKVQSRKISMYMREAKPEQILRRLAELGDMEIEPITLDDSAPGQDQGFRFAYKGVQLTEGPIGGPSGPVKLEDRSWTIPGAQMAKLKTELQGLLSAVGRLVVDEQTFFITAFDIKDNLDRMSKFLDPLIGMTAEISKDAQKQDPLVVNEYRMTRDASQQELITALKEVLSENGRIISNPDRNSIVVYELESRMPRITQIMRLLDTAPEQVLITAKLIEVTLDDYMGYGLELFTSHSADNLNDGRFAGGSQDTGSGTVGGLFGQPTGFDPFFATFTNPRIDVRLELLANEGRVETLSQPTQMVSNGQQARIEVGQEVPYLQSSGQTGGSTTASVSFKEVSIVMDVTPTVLEGGLIRLDVTVTVREVIGNIAIEGNNTPVLSKRESKTNVFVRDGETLVMGGLMRERERMEENGLPFLKDIPFLGYLFKSANRTTSKTDLLFFLRPQIVNVVKGAEIGETGEKVERDLRPLLYQDGDDRKANIRPNRYRRLEVAPKPAWYNDKARPKTAKEVKPGA
ncbi:MAG: type II secretion system protein GspD [Planctomycetes bacterium]|nr:type II secretion system protein GspD [Planctomycetota bacterium]